MQINQMKTFFEVVKAGSYSKASKNLFITQSAVSHQIKNLEKQLNIKVFERIGNIMKLTRKGELLLESVGTFLQEFEKLMNISKQIQDSKSGHLSIASTSGVMVYILPDVIRAFRAELPRIKLKLISWNISRDFLTMVSNGDVDLAIGPKSNQEPASNVEFLFWKSFKRILILAKNHPLRKKRTLKLADISAYPLILFRRGAETRRDVEDAFARDKLPYEIDLELDVAESVKIYVEMGFGLSVLPSFTITREDSDKFWFVDVSHLFGKVDYGIYLRKNKGINVALKHFIDNLWRYGRS